MRRIIVSAGLIAACYAVCLSESGHWYDSVCPMVWGLIAVCIGLREVRRG